MRIRTPDKKRATSLVLAAKNDLAFTKTIPVDSRSSATIVRNVYESFRMLGEALLRARGLDAQGHDETIGELVKLDVKTKRPLRALENLRSLRHQINYAGYRPEPVEAKDALELAQACFNELASAVETEIKNVR